MIVWKQTRDGWSGEMGDTRIALDTSSGVFRVSERCDPTAIVWGIVGHVRKTELAKACIEAFVRTYTGQASTALPPSMCSQCHAVPVSSGVCAGCTNGRMY